LLDRKSRAEKGVVIIKMIPTFAKIITFTHNIVMFLFRGPSEPPENTVGNGSQIVL